QALRRAGFAIAIEHAGDIAQPRGWRQHVVIGETVTETVGELGANVPAIVARDPSLAALRRKIVQHQPARLVGRAAALHGDIEELRSPFEAAVGPAEYVIGVHGLRI